jgi:hypothetical protein
VLCVSVCTWTPNELALPVVISDGKDDDITPSVDREESAG